MSKKYRSDAMAAIHETMEALHDIGAIDKQTMRRFDDACFTRTGLAGTAPAPLPLPLRIGVGCAGGGFGNSADS